MIRVIQIALDELAEAIAYYDQRQTGLGGRFLEDYREALVRVNEGPDSFAFIHPPYRCCRFRRFRYGLVYRIENRDIVIVAVMYLGRREDYWLERLAEDNLF